MDTEQEKAFELEATKEVKEEEVRAKVIEEYGFDPEIDAERIDKLVTKEVDSRQKLSAAIGQKIKYRTEAETLRTAPKPAAETKVETVDVSKAVAQELEKRDLESLDYPEDIKKNIQRISQVQGISIKQATRDPWIVSQVEAHEKAQKADEAAISRTNRSSGKQAFDINNPPQIDNSSPEARAKSIEDYEAWKRQAKKEGF